MIEIRHLRLFSILVKERHLTKAAEQLGIDQPSASRYLKQLEDLVGGELFFRGKRPMVLTPLGATLAERVEPVVGGYESLLDGLQQQVEDRPIVIVSNSQIVSRQLPNVVERFMKAHPEVGIRIRELDREEVVPALARGEGDIGIAPQRYLDHTHEFIPLGDIHEMLITPIGHPLMEVESITLRDLSRETLIFNARLPLMRDALRAALRRSSMTMKETIELDGYVSVKRYVEMGLGVAPVPSMVIEPGDRGHIIGRRLRVIDIYSNIGLVTVKGRTLPAAGEDFLRIAQEELTDNFDGPHAEALLGSG